MQYAPVSVRGKCGHGVTMTCLNYLPAPSTTWPLQPVAACSCLELIPVKIRNNNWSEHRRSQHQPAPAPLPPVVSKYLRYHTYHFKQVQVHSFFPKFTFSRHTLLVLVYTFLGPKYLKPILRTLDWSLTTTDSVPIPIRKANQDKEPWPGRYR